MEFMPQNAPLVVLTFLGACFGLVVLALVIAYGLVRGKRVLVKYGLSLALVGVGFYAVLLLGFSLASSEKVLAAGQQKYFCEIDCHVAYSVLDVATSKTLGAPPALKNSAGTFYVVKVRTWFDERTISPRRPKDASLTPNPREVVVVDDRGRQYPLSPEGQSALALMHGATTPLTQPLRPGESYATELIFDLPADAQNLRLLITDADGVTHFLIGHELSPLHKKIYFALTPQSKAVALRERYLALP